ncbi:MAG: SusD/RagB family nutrient-binding outer membrane lipoprotein [Bacteroides sp.]|nr:SusD/RagB family nutrient-binding outer membrane lipoprotein [Bacteroides sp.]
MKHIISNLLAGGALLLSSVACTGDYENINKNPFEPDDLTPYDYALASSMFNICNGVRSNDVNQYQLVESLMGSVLGGYFSDGNGNFTASFARCNPANNWSRVLMESNSTSIIPTLYTNLSMIRRQAEASGSTVALDVATLIKVATMSRITDAYGPIPYSKIGYDGNILTPYDSQEEVYNKFFEELTEAIDDLNQNSGQALNPMIDDVYQGNLSNWVRFGNSLKLRLALRISYVNPTKAKQMAEEAVNPANGGIIETVAQNAVYNHYLTGGNPIQASTVGYGNDSRPAADIVCYMNGYNDPRRAKYFTKANWLDANGDVASSPQGQPLDYVGVRRGWTTYDRDGWAMNMSAIAVGSTDAIVWLTASEVAFLRAEGAAVFGWNMGGTAESFYNQGIELSFEQYGVAGAEDYLADATSVPAAFYDPSLANPWNGSLPAVTIKWDDSLTPEQKQQKIITQKWIANWTLGCEAWADYRRTGYPTLIPIAYNGSGGIVDTNKGPQRLPYPQEEYTNNGANIQYAVENLLGNGGDNMGTKLWWACKPGL